MGRGRGRGEKTQTMAKAVAIHTHHHHRYPTRFRHRVSSSAPQGNLQSEQGLVACRNRIRKRKNHSPDLPNDFIFDVFLLLPAKVLTEAASYVCKGWYDIVKDPTFIRAHHQVSSTGVIVQDYKRPHLAFYLEEVNSSELTLTEVELPIPAKVRGSCHGLLLLQGIANPAILHVVNLITKTKVSLPPLQYACSPLQRCSIACTSDGQYKVVHASGSLDDSKLKVVVFTVGADRAWRVIDTGGIHMTKDTWNVFLNRPVVTAQFIYLVHGFCCFGFAVDVDAEMIHEFPAPEGYCFKGCSRDAVEMESGLGLINNDLREKTLVVWQMEDLRKWTKVFVIDVAAIKTRLDRVFYPCRLKLARPVMMNLKNGQLWLICEAQKDLEMKVAYLVCYYLKCGSILLRSLGAINGRRLTLYPHVNTLLSVKQC